MGKYSTPSTSTSSNKKAGGAKPDNPDIGKSGVTKGATSGEGGQYPFMPSASEYSGARDRKLGPGTTCDESTVNIPFMPKKAGDK